MRKRIGRLGRIFGMVLSTLAIMFAPAPAAAAAELPAGQSLLPDEDSRSLLETFDSIGAASSDTRMRIVEAPETSSGLALEARTLRQPDRTFHAQLRAYTAGPIARDDKLLVRFRFRVKEGESPRGKGRTQVRLETTDDHDMTLSRTVFAQAEQGWRTIEVPARSTITAGPGEAQLTFRIGYEPQTIEIADVELVNFGPEVDLADLPRTAYSYEGRGEDAPWRAQANERIERYRKADLQIRVEDADGRPLPDARVHAQMQRHAFGFGAAVSAYYLMQDPTYRQKVEQLYNRVVLENDLKWGPWEKGNANDPDNIYMRDRTMRALQWLNDRDIEVRGHWVAFAWAVRNQPYDDYHDAPETFRRMLFDHIDEKLIATQGLIDQWDVLNHLVGRGKALWEVFGSPEIYRDILDRTRELHPEATLWVNEDGVLPGGRYATGQRESYKDAIRTMMEYDAVPEGIGFMGHFRDRSLTAPQDVYRQYEDYHEAFGMPMQVTEFDITTDDQQLQADYMRDFLKISFSHPHVEGVVMWGFWEGRHWRPEAALYDEDWTIRPVGEAWKQRVLEEWWTEEDGRTDAEGRFDLRGFKGDYRIRVQHGEHCQDVQIHLDDATDDLVVRLGS